MDLNTIIGVVLGFALIGMAILLGGSPAAYIDIPSVLIVVGGSIAAVLTAFPMAKVLQLPAVFKKTIQGGSADPHKLVKQMVQFAEVARRDGILALEGMTEEMEDDLLVLGIKMAVDGTDPELIEDIMEADIENTGVRHSDGKGLFDTMGRFAPAFGMIGTLIGLVAMLANMSDPSAIGAGMAAALLTTMYGAIMANVLFLPLADKLKVKDADEMLIKTIIVKGVMSIQSGDNPRVVEQKLMTFLPPAQRPREGDDDMAQAA
ncbi:MAG: MotA/TolQ/ExbB proton channel family protein [Phycisphaerales bacterium]